MSRNMPEMNGIGVLEKAACRRNDQRIVSY